MAVWIDETFRKAFNDLFGGPPATKAADPEHIAHLERTRDALCEELRDLLKQSLAVTKELDEVLTELKEYTK